MIVFLLGVIVLYQSQYANGLFSKGLRNSEWMTVNGGRGFAEQGFLSNGGLPDILYGSVSPEGEKKKFIKLTYPPAPHWLAGIFIKICGLGNQSCYRIFPAILGIISLIFVAKILLSVLEPIKSALMMLSLAVVPTTIIVMHGLTYLSYSSSLFLVQLALLLKIFKEDSKYNKNNLLILFIAGFIQGWFSWDYLFLVCLSPIPFALLYFQDSKEYRYHVLLIILACSSGFLFAHFIHIIQVIIYKGGILAAYKPLYIKTMNRFDGSLQSEMFMVHESRLRILLNYLNKYASSGVSYKINFMIFLIFSIILILIREAYLTIQKPVQIALSWKSPSRNFFVIITAFIVSFLWIFIMKQHAAFHRDYFTMHLHLLYFICVLTILECVSFNKNNTIHQEK